MNRIYFPTSFFQDLRFRKLSVEARLVAVYLMTAPSVNLIGVYYLPMTQIERQLRLDPYYIKEALHCLEQLHFCRYDLLHEYVWICEFAIWQDQTELFPFEKALEKLGYLSFLPDFYDFYSAYYRDKKTLRLSGENLRPQEILDRFIVTKHKEGDQDGTY